MLDKHTINNVVDQLKVFQPEQIIINSNKTFSDPDIKIMIKKDNKEFVVENGLDDINAEITLIPVEKFITNTTKRNKALLDIYTTATTIYT